MKSQVEAAQREAEKQAKAISSTQMDTRHSIQSKEVSDLKRKNTEMENKMKSQTKELQTITEEV